MSVLESMRSGSDSTFMQVVLAAVVVSFVGFYALPQGDRSQVVASVNGVRIMDTTHTREYRRALREAEVRYNRSLSNDEQAAIGEQARQKLIEDEVVLQEAQRMGIEVSDSEIARYIYTQPFLQGEDGKFDPELLDRHLKRNQMSRSDFEDEIRKGMTREKLRLLVYTGASVSDAEIRQAWTEANTRVDLKYVKLRSRDFLGDVQVTPEQIDQYLTENEVEIKARYDRDFQRLYNLPERLRLRLIRIPVTMDDPVEDVLPRMNALHEQVEKQGADFAELARANSQDPSASNGGELEPRSLAQLGAEDAAALEGVEVGGLTRVIPTQTDVRMYQLIERIPAEVQEIDAVNRKIAEDMIREEGAPALAAAFAEDQLLAKWKETGDVPQELVDARGVLATNTGEIPVRAQPGNPFAPPPDLLAAARSATVGTVFPQVYEHGGALWVAQLAARTDPDPSLYELQRGDLVEPVLAEKRYEFFTGWVAAAKARARID